MKGGPDRYTRWLQAQDKLDAADDGRDDWTATRERMDRQAERADDPGLRMAYVERPSAKP